MMPCVNTFLVKGLPVKKHKQKQQQNKSSEKGFQKSSKSHGFPKQPLISFSR